jgi:hypothetical protein
MRQRDDVRIEAAPTATDEVRALVGELETVLAAEYPPEQPHGLSLDASSNRTSGSSSQDCAARQSVAAALPSSLTTLRSNGCMCGTAHGDRA